MTLYKNKYRVESARFKGWDYSSNGGYYITICVKNRASIFGYNENNKIILSNIGKIAEDCWRGIPDHFPFVKLDEFVIMPNHVHGIIFIEKNKCTYGSSSVCGLETENKSESVCGRESMHGPFSVPITVETQNLASLPLDMTRRCPPSRFDNSSRMHASRFDDPSHLERERSQFGPQSKNVASIIRGFKIGVTKYAVNNNISFKWQPRYYDHIISNDYDLNRIRQYIIDNPSNWVNDDNYITEVTP